MTETNTNPMMISTRSALDGVVDRIRLEKALAVDLEADSLFHFQEKVCLIQIGTRSACYIIDPLEITDLSGLGSVFADPEVKKIFHGADYDIRSLYRDFHFQVVNLFDTELACRFLGLKYTGLNAVLKKRADIQLDKRFQKKDWSQRPLPEEMITYAAQDVLYLIRLAEEFEVELAEKGRLDWLDEECALLCKVRPNLSQDEPLFLKFKGAGRLNKQALGALEALLQLRYAIARKKDRPLFKIFGNDSIAKMAVNRPMNLDQLKSLKVLSAKQLDMYGEAIVLKIDEVSRLNKNAMPRYPRKRKEQSKPALPHRLKALKQWRDEIADNLLIDPALILNKALMKSIAGHYPLDKQSLSAIEGIKNWQLQAFGSEIIEVINQS